MDIVNFPKYSTGNWYNSRNYRPQKIKINKHVSSINLVLVQDNILFIYLHLTHILKMIIIIKKKVFTK